MTVRYDEGVPQNIVTRAEARIGVPVRFLPGRKGKAGQPGEVVLEVRIRMQAPFGVSDSALAHAHPYNDDSAIEVFYSRINAYNPTEYRDALLGYASAEVHTASGGAAERMFPDPW